MGSDFVELLFPLRVRQFQFPKQTRCQSSRKPFIDKAYRKLGRRRKPSRKLTRLFRFRTVATIAVDRQPDHPSQDLIFLLQFLKVSSFLRFSPPLKSFQWANPSPAGIADRYTHSYGTKIDSGQSAGFGPHKFFLDLSQLPLLSQFDLFPTGQFR